MHPCTLWNNCIPSIGMKVVACESHGYKDAYYNITYNGKRKNRTSVISTVMVKYVMIIYIMEYYSGVKRIC